MKTNMKVLNSKGQEIVLNDFEKRSAVYNQRIANDLGFNVDIQLLTQISKKVTEQKFFEINPSSIIPIVVGQGAWSSNILTFRSFSIGDDFETGLIGNANSNDKLTMVNAGIDSVSQKNNTWAKSISWSIPELEEAARTGVWDIVTAKEESRKKNHDLGIQRIAFLGMKGNAKVLGLYNQAISSNTSLITKKISSMTAAELSAFCAAVIGAYRTNCHFTAWPTHFVLPETDYTGLAAPSSSDFPLKSKLALLEETFKVMCKNPNFQILPCAYGDTVNNSLGVNRYILLNYDEKSLKMDIPVPYTNTLANSLNSFQFQNVGYAQFTGVLAIRPLELFYMDF
jgi:hypothetical protein